MARNTSIRSAGDVLGRFVLAALLLLPASASARQDEEESLTPHQQAAREIAIAEAAASRVQQLRRHPDFRAAVDRDPELQPSLERAERLLAAARSGLRRAEQRQSATGFSDAGLLARRAARQLDDYEEGLKRAFRRIAAERAPPPPPEPPPPPPEPEPEAPPPAETGTTTPEPSAGTEAEPSPPVAEPSPPSRRPPQKLRQIADAYFAGDYERTIALASEASFSGRRAPAHALMLRAAARYALFLLGGETDYALRGLAIEDVTACRAADPDLAPDESAFSPRFRDFFAATR